MAFPDGWSNYWQATPINPEATLTGFQGYINLSRLSGLGGIARADGGDIRFSDNNNNRLACDLMPWYSNGSGLLIVSLGTKTTSNQTYRVWAGKSDETLPDITDPFGQTGTYYTGLQGYYPSGDGQDRTFREKHLHPTNVVIGVDTTMSGLKASVYDGVGAYCSGGTGIISAVPITFIAIANSIDITRAQGAVSIYRTSTNVDNFSLRWAGATAGDPIQGEARRNTAIAVANSSGSYLTDTFMHGAAVFRTATNRQAFLSGFSSGINTTNATPVTLNRIGLGLSKRTQDANPEYFSGYISIAQVYAEALSTGWIKYDNALMNQPVFWGDWSGATITQSESVLMTGVSFTKSETHNLINANRSIIVSSSNRTFTANSIQIATALGATDGTTTYVIDSVSVLRPITVINNSRTITNFIPNINKGMGASSLSSTRLDTLSTQLLKSLAAISSTNTADSIILNRALSINSVVDAATADIGSSSVYKILASTVNQLTQSIGSVGKIVSLDVADRTNTSVVGNVNLLLNMQAVSSILTLAGLDLEIGGDLDLLGVLGSRSDIFGNINLTIPFNVTVQTKTSDSLAVNVSTSLGANSNTKSSSQVNLLKNNSISGVSTVVTLSLSQITKNSGLSASVLADTDIRGQVIKSALFNAYLNISTRSYLGLDIEGAEEILLEAISSTLTRLGGTLRKSMQLVAHCHSTSSNVTTAGITRAIQTYIQSRTNIEGIVGTEINLNGSVDNTGLIVGTLDVEVNLSADLAGVIRAISALNGAIILPGESDIANIFPITVYINNIVEFAPEIYRDINFTLTAGIS